jgi:hypothetical protein
MRASASERQLRLAYRLTRGVATSAAVFDVSRYRQARFGGESAILHQLLRDRTRHVRDALIAGTAAVEACALVTNKTTALRNRARQAGIEVLSTAQLLASLTGRNQASGVH